MPNRFDTHPPGLTTPATKVAAVTPSDSTDLPDGVCRCLLVGTAGTATILDAEGNQTTLVPLIAGYNPIMVRRVFNTALTAANIKALY